MRLSAFESDDGLGTLGTEKDDGSCACVHGTPYRDASGVCRCMSELDGDPPPRDVPGGGGPFTWGPRKEVVNHVYQYYVPWEPISGRPDQEGTKTAVAEGFTLFGLSPLMLALIAGGGLWLMSSMDGKKKKGGEY